MSETVGGELSYLRWQYFINASINEERETRHLHRLEIIRIFLLNEFEI